MRAKDLLGKRGEELAAHFLQEHGYQVLESNWRCSTGEIDLIAEQSDVTVFVEVKTRSGLGCGHPFEAITPIKVMRLRKLSALWCQTHATKKHIRIDAIAVIAPPNKAVVIQHLVGIC